MQHTKKSAVLGWPVAHSLSPKLHQYWLKHYGIDGSYEAIGVEPDALGDTLMRLKEEGYAGCNLTIPHKEAVLPLLDAIDKTAEAIGAVNTLLIEDGQLIGSNSDAFGFMENLRSQLTAAQFDAMLVQPIILGAGGAARAVAYGLIEAGAPRVIVAARNLDKAASIKTLGAPLEVIAWEDVESALPAATLLINTTPLGMTGKAPLTLSLDGLQPGAVVTDIVYHPLKTQLLQHAEARGNCAIDGLGMLIFQAIPGFEQWFGLRPTVGVNELVKIKEML